MSTYEPMAGTTILNAVKEAFGQAVNLKEIVTFGFNGHIITVDPLKSQDENYIAAKKALGLPEIDVPFHPQTAADALKRWDEGQGVFTIEMGGIGPGYEQAIQILVFEIIRDNLGATLPDENDKDASKAFWDKFGDESIHRTNEKLGYSGAQVGAAKQVAYRALRQGWEAMLKTVPQDRLIQVSKNLPTLLGSKQPK